MPYKENNSLSCRNGVFMSRSALVLKNLKTVKMLMNRGSLCFLRVWVASECSPKGEIDSFFDYIKFFIKNNMQVAFWKDYSITNFFNILFIMYICLLRSSSINNNVLIRSACMKNTLTWVSTVFSLLSKQSGLVRRDKSNTWNDLLITGFFW